MRRELKFDSPNMQQALRAALANMQTPSTPLSNRWPNKYVTFTVDWSWCIYCCASKFHWIGRGCRQALSRHRAVQTCTIHPTMRVAQITLHIAHTWYLFHLLHIASIHIVINWMDFVTALRRDENFTSALCMHEFLITSHHAFALTTPFISVFRVFDVILWL